MEGSGTEGPNLVGHADAGTTGRLRALWCRRSRQTGWEPPDDWWTPAVDSVCRAAETGNGLVEACTRFGRARARSGVGVGAALDDFLALGDVLRWPRPPASLVKALVEGWVDGGRSSDDCLDPLTGLTTMAYLRTRLGELYRSTAPELTHRLLIIGLEAGIDPWRRTARLIMLGHEMRRRFPRGETLSLLSRTRIGVLAPTGPDLDAHVRVLRVELSRAHGAELWSVPMPPTHSEALSFLDDVGKPPMLR
ncbi:hypothetical protein [Nocardiopsis ansamitocini]|uniref:Uncharacterized protein n=1 Tax=Nocardiopsis ansamitocini TaxID=1670832 RepID=A0A9W6P9T7_9ACTN|nr:hypothetical protein [Nocardiopsis ansamitocini]GLU49751.1 hypothetical protein Nans01_41020 [Nocardiopsis ansamitocini]